jgi:hypothetical protein
MNTGKIIKNFESVQLKWGSVLRMSYEPIRQIKIIMRMRVSKQ